MLPQSQKQCYMQMFLKHQHYSYYLFYCLHINIEAAPLYVFIHLYKLSHSFVFKVYPQHDSGTCCICWSLIM